MGKTIIALIAILPFFLRSSTRGGYLGIVIFLYYPGTILYLWRCASGNDVNIEKAKSFVAYFHHCTSLTQTIFIKYNFIYQSVTEFL